MIEPSLEVNVVSDLIVDFDTVLPTDTTNPNNPIIIPSNDYTLIEWQSENRFKIKFDGNYVLVDQSIKVVFEAEYGHKKVSELDGTNSNFAHLFYNGTDKTAYVSQYTTVNNRTLNNGFKTGSYNYLTQEITWTAYINYNRILSNNDKTNFSDTIPQDQEYVHNSVIIKKFSVDSDGEVVVDNSTMDDYQIVMSPWSSNNNTLGILINSESANGFQISFKTKIKDSDLKYEYHNDQVKFHAGNKWYENTINAKVEIDAGEIYIIKKDELGEPLNGVRFTLYNSDGELVFDKFTTQDGAAAGTHLEYGTYKLYEHTTRDGYNIPEELVAGVDVVIGSDSDISELTYEFYNLPTKVFVHKMGVYENTLDWALFQLEMLTDDGFKVVRTDLELIEGTLIMSKLTEGTYRLTETKATPGYLLNTKPVDFELHKNEDGNIEDMTLYFVNYQGSVKLLKTNEKDIPLKGVKFDLYDSTNTLLHKDLKTDLDGLIVVNDLAPGDYYFVETETTSGMELIPSPITFTIVNKADDEPEIVTLVVVNKSLVDNANASSIKESDKDNKVLESTIKSNIPNTGIIQNNTTFILIIIVSGLYLSITYCKKRYN